MSTQHPDWELLPFSSGSAASALRRSDPSTRSMVRSAHWALGVRVDWAASSSSPLAGVGVLRNQGRDLSLVHHLSHAS